ncbi:MAG: hypothetical protein ACO23N_04050 [Opitutales bacterium]
MDRDVTVMLPPGADAELALSLERAHHETQVLDRLTAVWSLLLAKCCLLQSAILHWSIPIGGLAYVWSLSLALGAFATYHYLRAHEVELLVVPVNRRLGSTLLLGLILTFLGAAHATFALDLVSPPVLAALTCCLGAIHALSRAAMRRRAAPFLGSLAWWTSAWLALRQPDDLALAVVGLGFLLGHALPGFALVREAVRRRA